MTRWLIGVVVVVAGQFPLQANEPAVEFVEGDRRIDVVIGGNPFTSYIYPETLPKPSLYPVRTPAGIVVTRNYPQMEGESDDHPHHVGIFFAADGVNGNSFWLNTSQTPHIEHVNVARAEGGAGQGTLSTVARWVAQDGTALFEETRDMVFRAGDREYSIDFTIGLRALKDPVTITDPKEALLGVRVADWMREEFKAAPGVVTISGAGHGQYLSSNGDVGEKDVWGRRATWVRLEAAKDGQTVGIAMFDHPTSVNHPTYWHARGYGLFAANPVGQQVFEKARNPDQAKPLNLAIAPGESAVFRYRVLVYDGPRTKEQLDEQFAAFAK